MNRSATGSASDSSTLRSQQAKSRERDWPIWVKTNTRQFPYRLTPNGFHHMADRTGALVMWGIIVLTLAALGFILMAFDPRWLTDQQQIHAVASPRLPPAAGAPSRH